MAAAERAGAVATAAATRRVMGATRATTNTGTTAGAGCRLHWADREDA